VSDTTGVADHCPLACDNVFFIIYRVAFEELKSPEAVSVELCELAIRLGSSDNVTVVVVQFHHV
jgi:serine/threonine protein phosphatase PrpC